MRKALHVLAIALLLVTAILGLNNGVRELGDGTTVLQHSVTVAVVLYGVLGLAGAYGLWRRRPWAPVAVGGWALASAWAGTVASFAFHDPNLENAGTVMGASSALGGILLIGALMVWIARVAIRSQVPSLDASPSESASPPSR